MATLNPQILLQYKKKYTVYYLDSLEQYQFFKSIVIEFLNKVEYFVTTCFMSVGEA